LGIVFGLYRLIFKGLFELNTLYGNKTLSIPASNFKKFSPEYGEFDSEIIIDPWRVAKAIS
jgi:hypothetical protein